MKKLIMVLLVLVVLVNAEVASAQNKKEELGMVGPVKEVVMSESSSEIAMIAGLSREGREIMRAAMTKFGMVGALYDEKGRMTKSWVPGTAVTYLYNEKNKTFSYRIEGENQNIVKFNGELDSVFGKPIKTYLINFKGESHLYSTSKYDEKGYEVESILYSKDIPMSHLEFEYDVRGNIIKKISKKEDGTTRYIEIREYNSRNDRICDYYIMKDGRRIENPLKRYYKYNQNGFFEKFVDESGADFEGIGIYFTYKEIDKYGNWQERMTNDPIKGETSVVKRRITYYDEE